MSDKKYFKLYACCIIVKGSFQHIICDLQRVSYYVIPPGLIEFLEDCQNTPVEEALLSFPDDVRKTIEDWLEDLSNLELGFYCNNPERFPDIELSFDAPEEITNSIVELKAFNENYCKKVFCELIELRCKAIEIRCYFDIEMSMLHFIASLFKDAYTKSLLFVLPYSKSLPANELNDFLLEWQRVQNLFIYNYPSSEEKIDNFRIITMPDDIADCTSCGVIKQSLFQLNLRLFSEAQSHNSCLNRKISVDQDGNIKNCPSMQQSFGNITETTFEQALNHPEFKKIWNISKNEIHVCKDCEFRYICTDCRAYVENPEDIFSKPLKCGYNPYTATWEEWSVNPLKQGAMVHYGMRKTG